MPCLGANIFYQRVTLHYAIYIFNSIKSSEFLVYTFVQCSMRCFSENKAHYQKVVQYLYITCATFLTSRKSAIKPCRLDLAYMQQECVHIPTALALYYLNKKFNF